MKTNNKMKDYEEEYKDWWEVVKEYFAKELEKNLTQHKVDEIILRYKLEVYQKNFIDFVYGSSTRTKALGYDEETKVRPSEITQKEEVQTK